jgi:hypothetical protein
MEYDDEGVQPANPLEGRYANYFKVGHNSVEFVLDFGQFYPENGGVQFHTRIVSIPIYTKAMLQTLGEAIDRYEQTFGAIEGS